MLYLHIIITILCKINKMKKLNKNVEVIVANANDIKDCFEILNEKIDRLFIKSQNNEPLGDIIFMNDVCKMTDAKRATIYSLVHYNKIPFVKPEGTKKLMFSRKAIKSWLLNRNI